MSILINLLLAIFVLVSMLMVLVILMQRPKSEGLGAAFGAGMTENIFGAQTTNVLQKFTVWLAGIFLATALALTTLYAHKSGSETGLRKELAKAQGTPGASPAGTPGESPSPTPEGTAAATSPAEETTPTESSPAGSPTPATESAASPAETAAPPDNTAATPNP
jgi:preprotein translocase subunit SecG